jgi:hypothetical protein
VNKSGFSYHCNISDKCANLSEAKALNFVITPAADAEKFLKEFMVRF